MNPLYAEVLSAGQGVLLAGFVVFLRIGGAMVVLPAFGETMVPARVKLVVALAFTAIVLPGAMPALRGVVTEFSPGIWLLAEALIGLALGLAFRFFVMCLQIAGTMAAQSISLSQLFGGTTGEPQPAVGELLTLAGLALAVHLGLHVKLVQIFISSYEVFPPGAFPSADLMQQWQLGGIARAFALAFSLAAPFVIAGLIYNIALGAINRAMPQLMVAFVGAPALTLGGLTLLMIALPTALMIWNDSFDAFLANPFTVTR